MKTPSSLFLAATLLCAAAGSSAAQTETGPASSIAHKLDDPKQREEAAKQVEDFLLEPDASGKSFVGESVNRAALAGVARAWAASAKAGDLAAFVTVATPRTKSESRLRARLVRWTGDGQIKAAAEKDQAGAFLADAFSKAKEVLGDPQARQEIDASIAANDATATQVPGAREWTKRAQELRENQKTGANPALFGPERAVQDLPSGASEAPGPGKPLDARPSAVGGGGSAAEIAAALNAAFKDGKGEPKRPAVTGAEPPPVDAPVVLKALGSAEVAKEPGVLDRASSLAASDSKTVAADLANIRATMAGAEIPNVNAINEGNTGAIREFFTWLRTAKEADMPAIDYTILPKGEIGNYELGLLSKGDIKVNHFIRNEPAHARASVVVHELYHYWDKKVARNHYPNVSYGKIDPANKHIHEYDAYLATSLYWQMVKQEGDSSALARVLDRIPTDPGEVRDLVNKGAGK